MIARCLCLPYLYLFALTSKPLVAFRTFPLLWKARWWALHRFPGKALGLALACALAIPVWLVVPVAVAAFFMRARAYSMGAAVAFGPGCITLPYFKTLVCLL